MVKGYKGGFLGGFDTTLGVQTIRNYESGGFITKSDMSPTSNVEDTSGNAIWWLNAQLMFNKDGVWPTEGMTFQRGVFAGGNYLNVIQYIDITSTGNATDFGDLSKLFHLAAGCASSTRGLFGGGEYASYEAGIDYITIASTGNGIDFGDLTVARRALAACSSSTRGIFGGGYTGSYSNVLDYVTIGSTGDATDFGNLSVARTELASCGSTTRGVWAGGMIS